MNMWLKIVQISYFFLLLKNHSVLWWFDGHTSKKKLFFTFCPVFLRLSIRFFMYFFFFFLPSFSHWRKADELERKEAREMRKCLFFYALKLV